MGRAVQVEWLLHGVTDASGVPMEGGKVYFYEPGTTTDKTVWEDVAKTTPASQPVILDSAARAQIYADGEYRLVVDDSADVNVHDFDPLRFFFPDPSTMWDSAIANNVEPDGTAGGNVWEYLHQAEAAHPTDGYFTPGVEVIGLAGSANTSNRAEIYASLNGSGVPTRIAQPSNDFSLDVNFPQADDLIHAIFNGENVGKWTLLSEGANSASDISASPTYTGEGTLTYTSVTVNHAEEIRVGNESYFFFDITGTVGGAGSAIRVEPKFFNTAFSGSASSVSGYTGCAAIFDGSGLEMGFWLDFGSDKLAVYKKDGSDWGTGSGRRIIFSGVVKNS